MEFDQKESDDWSRLTGEARMGSAARKLVTEALSSFLFSQTDGAFRGGGVYDVAFLEDLNFVGANEAARGLAGSFHLVAPLVFGKYKAGGFAGADRGIAGALIEEVENGFFELAVDGTGF